MTCKYSGIREYLDKLYNRCNTSMNDIDSVLSTLDELEAELSTCAIRDWQIIRQAQNELCYKVVTLYREQKKGL